MKRLLVWGILIALVTLTGFVAPANTVVASHTVKEIGVNYAWTKADITYSISGATAEWRQFVRDVLTSSTPGDEGWVPIAQARNMTLTEVAKGADIQIKLKVGGGVVQGLAVYKLDRQGYLKGGVLNISLKAFGDPNTENEVKIITRHEVGHLLGIGHANFGGDLMSTTVSAAVSTISVCDINALEAANHWIMVDGPDKHHPHVTHVGCN